ncbi:MAG: aspartate 1-decarboxylase [Oscillospiraceae bacterium]|jgi:aspartate 1-decarboxylase|nr:aspartate 1-decarboxylase [Oscillospiraceae bacterium]MDD3260807.1 aspartate 1-decarboxylase [Oscillospiraceae bacterium]
MQLTMLKAKIHRATVTQADIHYVGSITIDQSLMQAAGIRPYEQVQVADIDNGSRLVTYAIPGKAGSGTICINGAGAKLVNRGDKVIIMCYCQVSEQEAAAFEPTVVFVNAANAACARENCN